MKKVHQDDILIFLHLPKAAGTTFNKIIDRQFANEFIFANNKIVRDELGSNWKKYDPHERESIAKRKLDALSNDHRSTLKLLRGHMEFGWHTSFTQKASYLTFLRDPIDRVVSQYHYIKRLKGHKLEKLITKNNLSLSDFVEQGLSVVTDNGMTRKVAGLSDGVVGFKDYDNDILALAKKNIDSHFAFIGISEYFDESLILLGDLLNWKNLYYHNKNVTVDRKKVENYSTKEISRVKEHVELDVELYNYALSIFKKAYENDKNKYDKKLKTFQKTNSIYQKMMNLKSKVKKIVVN